MNIGLKIKLNIKISPSYLVCTFVLPGSELKSGKPVAASEEISHNKMIPITTSLEVLLLFLSLCDISARYLTEYRKLALLFS
jgi:hypothetical protein